MQFKAVNRLYEWLNLVCLSACAENDENFFRHEIILVLCTFSSMLHGQSSRPLPGTWNDSVISSSQEMYPFCRAPVVDRSKKKKRRRKKEKEIAWQTSLQFCVINKILPAYQGRHSFFPEHSIFVVFLRVESLRQAFLPRLTRSWRPTNLFVLL